jgi:hypothetical protein
MYGLWFKKPMDIHDPTVLSREETEQMKDIPPHPLIFFSTNPNFSKRAANWGIFPRDRVYWQVFPVLGVQVVLCAVYGGVHLSTWNFDFPTPIEQKLWRIACILTVAGSPLTPWFFSWSEQVFHEESFIEGTIAMITGVFEEFRGSGSFWGGCSQLLHCFAVLFSPLLLASRLFLVVESFISLRDVPSGVYVTVPWAQYIPHI